MYQTIKASYLKIREPKTSVMLNTPVSVFNYAKDIKDLSQETIHVITLNSKNKVIDRHMVSMGIANTTLFHSREAFRSAILDNALSVIFIHNHPSGDTTPSQDDFEITKKMCASSNLLGIPVFDHIIIGDGYYSMSEHGYINTGEN
jgi:DNA repair protein RadC